MFCVGRLTKKHSNIKIIKFDIKMMSQQFKRYPYKNNSDIYRSQHCITCNKWYFLHGDKYPAQFYEGCKLCGKQYFINENVC
jgi:hypothetical protein